MSDTTRTEPRPTVALVQGAFADSSSWSGVIGGRPVTEAKAVSTDDRSR